jgi:hypothetical protein
MNDAGIISPKLRQDVWGISRVDCMNITTDSRVALAIRIIVLVVLPFLLGAVVLQHTEGYPGTPLQTPAELPRGYLQAATYEVTQSALMQNPSQITSFFPFANYLDFPPLVSHGTTSLCFQDTGSYVTYPNGTNSTPVFQWEVTVNNVSNVSVAPDSTNCIPATTNGQYSFKWNADFPTAQFGTENLSEVIFTPQIVAYPIVTMDYGILQGLAFIPAFYLFIFYPAAGIWKKIHSGFLAQ